MKKHLHGSIKILVIISSGLGVFLNLVQENFSLNALTYFTHQANLLVFIVYTVFLFYDKKYKQTFITILYQAVVAIVLTSLVYHVMLRPIMSDPSFTENGLINLLAHTITPILVVAERVLFSTKGVLQRKQPILWLSFPMYYFVFTIVYASLGGVFRKGTEYESKYPYFFLNFKENGIGYFLVVVTLVLIIGYSTYFLNRRIFLRKRD
ncbi:MAG: Pr6Pr family membrane protein [Tenericutes bacterium]|nr:Pr6Pr family membrane protein [Mycoplasmatota bacterium]